MFRYPGLIRCVLLNLCQCGVCLDEILDERNPQIQEPELFSSADARTSVIYTHVGLSSVRLTIVDRLAGDTSMSMLSFQAEIDSVAKSIQRYSKSELSYTLWGDRDERHHPSASEVYSEGQESDQGPSKQSPRFLVGAGTSLEGSVDIAHTWT